MVSPIQPGSTNINTESGMTTTESYGVGDSISIFSRTAENNSDPRLAGLRFLLKEPHVGIAAYLKFIEAFILKLQSAVAEQKKVDSAVNRTILRSAVSDQLNTIGDYNAALIEFRRQENEVARHNQALIGILQVQSAINSAAVTAANAGIIALNSVIGLVNPVIDFLNIFTVPINAAYAILNQPQPMPLAHLPSTAFLTPLPPFDPNDPTYKNKTKAELNNLIDAAIAVVSGLNAAATGINTAINGTIRFSIDVVNSIINFFNNTVNPATPLPTNPNKRLLTDTIVANVPYPAAIPGIPLLDIPTRFVDFPSFQNIRDYFFPLILALLPLIKVLLSRFSSRFDLHTAPKSGIVRQTQEAETASIQPTSSFNTTNPASSSLLAMALGTDRSGKLSRSMGLGAIQTNFKKFSLHATPVSDDLYIASLMKVLEMASLNGILPTTLLLTQNTGSTRPLEGTMSISASIGNLEALLELLVSDGITDMAKGIASSTEEKPGVSAPPAEKDSTPTPSVVVSSTANLSPSQEEAAASVEALLKLLSGLLAILIIGLAAGESAAARDFIKSIATSVDNRESKVPLASQSPLPSLRNSSQPDGRIITPPSLPFTPLLDTEESSKDQASSTAPLEDKVVDKEVLISQSNEEGVPPELIIATKLFVESIIARIPEGERETLKTALSDRLNTLLIGPPTAFSTESITLPNERLPIEGEKPVGTPSDISETGPATLAPPPLLKILVDQAKILYSSQNRTERELVDEVVRDSFEKTEDLDVLLRGLLDPGKGFAMWGWGPMYPDRHYPGQTAVTQV